MLVIVSYSKKSFHGWKLWDLVKVKLGLGVKEQSGVECAYVICVISKINTRMFF